MLKCYRKKICTRKVQDRKTDLKKLVDFYLYDPKRQFLLCFQADVWVDDSVLNWF